MTWLFPRTADTLATVDFPELLLDAQSRLGLVDQEALAEHIGITTSALSKWMRRRQTPPRTRWDGLAATLRVSVAELGAAITDTEMDRTPTTSTRLRKCEEEVERLRQENRYLRSRLHDGR